VKTKESMHKINEIGVVGKLAKYLVHLSKGNKGLKKFLSQGAQTTKDKILVSPNFRQTTICNLQARCH
jgi:hypothetical protein